MKKLVTQISVAALLFATTTSYAQDLKKEGENNKCGYVTKGAKRGLMGWKFVIKADYTCRSGEFDAETNLALVQSSANNKWGIINKKGELVIPLEYQEGTAISNGKIVAKKDDRYGLLDATGKILLPFEYDYMTEETSEKSKVLLVRKGENPNRKYGLIDYNGKIIVPIEYDIIRFVPITMSNGSKHFNMKKDGKYGLYGLDEGKFLTGVVFDSEINITSMQKPIVYKGNMDGDEYEITEAGVAKYIGAGKPKSTSSPSSSSASKTAPKKAATATSSTFKCVKCNQTETKAGNGSPSGGKCSAHVSGSGSSTSHTWKKI